jgi:hypothetical protein
LEDKIRVLAFGYNTKSVHHITTQTIGDHAGDLLETLRAKRAYCEVGDVSFSFLMLEVVRFHSFLHIETAPSYRVHSSWRRGFDSQKGKHLYPNTNHTI